METVAFCEIDPFCREVLKKHWPAVPIYEDIRELKGDEIEADIICGGFPCQDISVANTGGKGLEGERSGLWGEYKRIIGEAKPDYAIIENVANLRRRGLVTVLRDLGEIGYDAEWHIISASSVGLPHSRERIWIIAYPRCREPQQRRALQSKCADISIKKGEAPLHDQISRHGILPTFITDNPTKLHRKGAGLCVKWPTEFPICEPNDGIPNHMVLKALGNAVVPQIPEIIGRAIIDFELTQKIL